MHDTFPTDPETYAQTTTMPAIAMTDFPTIGHVVDARGTASADDATAKLRVAIDMQYLTIDRILGLPDGTTSFGWPDVVDLTMAIEPINSPKRDDPDDPNSGA